MSLPHRLATEDRQASIHPALHPSVTNVPVTPGVHLGGHSAYTELDSDDSDSKSNGADLGQPEDGSYFAARSDPNDTSKGEKIGKSPGRAEQATSTKLRDVDLQKAYPQLSLSGRIISATFSVPYTLGYVPGRDWELNPRRGTSALFDSLAYLSSSASPFDHTLVAWTGEIKQTVMDRPLSSASFTSSNVEHLGNKASAPIPVDGAADSKHTTADGLRIHRADRERLEKQFARDQHGKILPVWLTDDVDEQQNIAVFKDQSRWRRYAERELYTTFHYKQNSPTDGRAARKHWADYYLMNRMFADRIIDAYRPGDIVIVHDYYLLLLPSLLRQRLPNVYIGFFLHVPFPSSEYYRCISRRKELLEGVLGANMIGFQSFSYSRHFTSCCTRILGFESSQAGVDAFGAHVAIDVFPIGIDAEAAEKKAFEDPEVYEKAKAIKAAYPDMKIIVGRDRLDSIRGVAQKLQAFEIFLERYPEWNGKVILIQVTSPGSVNQDQADGDKSTVNRVADLVARINGKYGSLSYTPIHHMPQYLSKEEYYGLLQIADVGLITSVRDGMNTTSLEYVICQKDNCGPLIISEFSGTAGTLSNAIHINPWDLGSVADAIEGALLMPFDKRKEQHDILYRRVVENDVRTWTDTYLMRLVTNLSAYDQSTSTPSLDRAKLLLQYKHAGKRLFLFDYDGTLTPIVRDPQAATPTDRVLRTLKTLASDPMNSVWIISGRDQNFLETWMGHIEELGFSAEHGSFIRHPGGKVWENLAETMDMSWRAEVREVFQQYTEKTPGSIIEEKNVAITWHYRGADPELGLSNARECQKFLENTVAKKWDVDVMPGKANIEIRPRFINKGEIAKRLVHEAGDDLQFVLCLGDDFTDEDMFRSLRRANLPEDFVFSCTVGASSKQTIASWHLVEPSDVISVLSLLNGSADAGNVGAVAVVEGHVPESRL